MAVGLVIYGAIMGGLIGGALLIMIVSGLFWYCRAKRYQRAYRNQRRERRRTSTRARRRQPDAEPILAYQLAASTTVPMDVPQVPFVEPLPPPSQPTIVSGNVVENEHVVYFSSAEYLPNELNREPVSETVCEPVDRVPTPTNQRSS